MSKKITVIIPCYNTEKYIDRCLDSITFQTIGMESLSIICVNDASTDHTLHKLKKWEARFPKDIFIIDCKQNGRQGYARNLGLAQVKTPYVTYVDSDDWIETDMYEKMYDMAEAHLCDIVNCNYSRDNGNNRFSTQTSNPAPSRLLFIHSPEERKKFIVSNIIGFSCCNKLIRTNFLRTNHIFFPEKLAYEDIYWGSLLYLHAETIGIMENSFYHYFVNDNSTVLAMNQTYHRDIFLINDLKWNACKERGSLAEYSAELKFDYLVTGYLSILKILALRYTTDTYEDYLRLYHTVTERVPDFATNPYLNLLTEFQQLQIQLLQNLLSRAEWSDFCQLIRKHS